MNEKGIDQAPVIDGNEFIGSLSDSKLLKSLIDNPDLKNKPVSEVMDTAFQFVALDNTLDVLSSLMKKDKGLLVRDTDNRVHIITQSDLLVAMTN
jgi:cystathionine beta-synthase